MEGGNEGNNAGSWPCRDKQVHAALIVPTSQFVLRLVSQTSSVWFFSLLPSGEELSLPPSKCLLHPRKQSQALAASAWGLLQKQVPWVYWTPLNTHQLDFYYVAFILLLPCLLPLSPPIALTEIWVQGTAAWRCLGTHEFSVVTFFPTLQLVSTWVVYLDLPKAHLRTGESGRNRARALERGTWNWGGCIGLWPVSATSCVAMASLLTMLSLIWVGSGGLEDKIYMWEHLHHMMFWALRWEQS